MSQIAIQSVVAGDVTAGLAAPNGNPDTLYRLGEAPYELHKLVGDRLPLSPIGTMRKVTPGAISGTATISAAALASGGLVFTGGAGTQTLPTAALLLAQLGGGGKGTIFDFFVDNSAGSGTCTLAVSASILVPATIVVTGGATLTVAGQATGLALFRIVFSSATAAVIFRMG